jgi:hypothetical protein
MRSYLIALLIVSVCGIASESPAAISISLDRTYAAVDDGAGGSNAVNITNTGGTVATATLPGFFSQTTSNYSTFVNGASLSGTFDQQRRGDNVFAYSFGYLQVFFSTDVNALYSAAGLYSNSAGFTEFGGYLLDVTTSTYLYYSDQLNSSTLPAAFTLGGLAGNSGNTFTGSLTGSLIAAHSFEWFHSGYTQALPTPDGGAIAGGSGSLAIANVPEASSLIVCSLLAMTFAGAGWWKRSQLAA